MTDEKKAGLAAEVKAPPDDNDDTAFDRGYRQGFDVGLEAGQRDGLRCELIRSATAVVCSPAAVDRDRRNVAWEFLLRELRAAEPKPRAYETDETGHYVLTPEDLEKLKERAWELFGRRADETTVPPEGGR